MAIRDFARQRIRNNVSRLVLLRRKYDYLCCVVYGALLIVDVIAILAIFTLTGGGHGSK